MPLPAAATPDAANALVATENKQPGCCEPGGCCCPEAESADVSLDGDAISAMRKDIDPAEVADLDVYVSSLTAPSFPGVLVVKEFGLVSSTFTRVKKAKAYTGKYEERVQQWAAENALEAETARAMAIGKLRTKAKAAGANAIFGLALDCENEQAERGPGGVGIGAVGLTMMIATGTAVQLGGDLSGLVLALDDKHCLYAGPYERNPTRGTVPLEMERGTGYGVAAHV